MLEGPTQKLTDRSAMPLGCLVGAVMNTGVGVDADLLASGGSCILARGAVDPFGERGGVLI
jgi:hypothetical protein